MRKVYSVLIGIFFTLAFTTCKQFNADIDEYLSYWSAEAFIRSASIEAVTQTDVTGVASVASEKDVTVTLKVQNPKSFRFALPSASETRNIVHFEQLTEAKPVAGTDYELKQLEGDTLQLIYKTGFLKKHEWGEKDLSSVITLIAQDGRVFKQTYTFRIKANTPPPKPIFTVAKTVGTPAYYVLCITVPNMDKRVSGGLLHKDITRIEVNGTPYTFSVNEAHNAFTKPESDLFITASNVEKLNEPGAEEVPAGGWVLHYKTDVEVKDGAAKKEYTVRLSDEKGLVSGILNASTKPNKPTAEGVTVTKGEEVSGSGSESDHKIIGSDSAGAELAISSATGGTTVHCTLTDIDSAAFVQYDGNPITVPLPLNGAGEKKYKLEYYTDGEGFAATAVKTVYYTIREKHTVTFDADGGTPVPDAQTVLHGGKVADPSASVSKTGFYLDGWYTEKAYTHKWDFNTGTVTSNMTLYANWIPGSGIEYTVKHYQQNVNDDNYPAAPTDTDNPTGTTGANAAVTLKNYPGFETGTYTAATIAADGTTVVEVYYQRKQITVTFKLNGGNVGGSTDDVTDTSKYGATLTAPTAEWTGHTLSGWAPALLSPPTFPTTNTTYTAQWNVNVTFSVDGTGGTLKATPEGGDITTTSPVTVKHDGSVTFTATPNEGWEVAGWKVGGSVIPNHTDRTYTLRNVTEPKNVTVKFYQSSIPNGTSWKDLLTAVESAPDGATITINGTITATSASDDHGEIKVKKKITIKGKDASAVLDAANFSRIFHVQDGKTLTLENITLTGGKATGSGEAAYGGGILVKEGGKAELKNCTVKACEAAEKGGGIYSLGEVTLDASTIGGSSASDGNKAKRGGGISVEKGTIDVSTGSFIQYNQTAGSSGMEAGGGGIFIRYGKLTLRGTVADNTALNGTAFVLGGGVYVGAQGEFIMETGATISGNTSKFGGGVYIDVVPAGAGTFTMKGGTISGCKAGGSGFSDAQGGGVYIEVEGTKQGTFSMEGGSITDCTAEATNAGGGGIYADNGAVFKMSGGAVITPSTQTNTSTVKYNDVYLEGTASDNAKITVNGTLTGTAPVARITVGDDNYKYSTQVLAGAITTGSPENYTKFTVTSKVLEDGIAEIWKIRANGNLEKSKYIDVRYDKLAYYLSSAYASSHAVDGINYIKITGTIPPEDLRSKYFERMGKLARTIQDAHKKVALILPDRIPGLGGMYQCFYECEYLVSLENIPLGVTGIQECFKGCKNLTKAPVIPDSVDNMEECFQSCEALKEAPAIPSGVTAIKSCFNGCKELTKAPVLPSGVTDIYACFAGCEKLTKAPAIPSGVREIEHCFDGCKALTQGPDIPSTVTNIQKCFKGCTNLKKVTLNCVYGNVHAFSDIFKDCTSLDDGGIKVPSGQLQTYKDNAGNMGTTDDKFSGF